MVVGDAGVGGDGAVEVAHALGDVRMAATRVGQDAARGREGGDEDDGQGGGGELLHHHLVWLVTKNIPRTQISRCVGSR